VRFRCFPDGLRQDRRHEQAELAAYVVGPGPLIHVEGGGGGSDHSNCTTSETNTTVTAGADPTNIPFGFNTDASGSCFFQPSYSFFTVTITGKNSLGAEVFGTARVRFGQIAQSTTPYEVNCATASKNVTCQETGDKTLTLTLNRPQP
jgi:hypothetical protein